MNFVFELVGDLLSHGKKSTKRRIQHQNKFIACVEQK
jgi:hypothetical protein